MGPFNQPGDIGHNKFLAINPDHPQIWVQGGRDNQQFSGVPQTLQTKKLILRHWQAKQTSISNQLQPEPDPHFAAFFTRLGPTRGLIR